MKHYPAVSKNTPTFKKTLLALSVGALLTGCYGDQNEDQAAVSSGAEERQVSSDKLWKATRFQSSVTAQAESCANGGITINAGFDLDGNGVLDSDEIDQTQTLCNGADAAISSQVIAEGDAQACNGAGGTRLIVGSETVDICNAGQGTPSYDYVAAKSLAQGFGTWVSNLETYADDLAMSLEEQSTQINALMDGQGVDTSLTAIGFLIQTIDEADTQGFTNTNVADVWGAMLPSNIQSVTGTIAYDATTGTVTVQDFSAEIITDYDYSNYDYMDPTSSPVPITDTATVTTDGIVIPDTSVAGTVFTVTLNNVVAQTSTGKVTLPVGSATMTTTNEMNLSAETEQAPGAMTVQLDLGSEAAPVRLESIGTDYGTATDKGEIVFEGNLKATVKTYEYGLVGVRTQHDIASIIGGAFNGQLSYDGQAVDIALTAEVDQVTQKDTAELEAMFPSLMEGNVLNGAYSASAADKTIELKGTHGAFEDNFDGQVIQIVEFTSNQLNSLGDKAYLVLRERPNPEVYMTGSYTLQSNVDGSWVEKETYSSGEYVLNTYDSSANLTQSESYDQLGNLIESSASAISLSQPESYDGIPDDFTAYHLVDSHYLYEMASSTTSSYPLSTIREVMFPISSSWFDDLTNTTQLWSYGSNLQFYGYVSGTFDLPDISDLSTVQTTSYDLTVDWVDYPEARRSFDNHGRYIVTAQLDLNAINAASTTGGTLADTSIGVKAERFGYSGSLGDLQFKLDHGGESFVANYYHGDITGPWGEEDFRWEPKGFSFTDADGGLITMDDMDDQFWWDCQYGGYNYGANPEAACALGARSFDINVNGVTHGRMWQDSNGDWLVNYKDGTEERVYTYQ